MCARIASIVWALSCVLPAYAQAPNAGARAEGRVSAGTGFLVDASGRLITNSHVVEGCSTVEIWASDGSWGRGSVVARDATNDLALVASPLTGRAVAAFRRSPIRSGETVIAMGFPFSGLLASDVNVSTGIVSAMAGLKNDTSKVQISAPVQPGNSGGPLLDSSGRVVGVVVEKLDALAVAKVTGDIPQNINFAIKGELAKVFLRSHGVSPREAPDFVKPTSVADIVDVARQFTLLLQCRGEGAVGVSRREKVDNADGVTGQVNDRAPRSVSGTDQWCRIEQDLARCQFRTWEECETARRSDPNVRCVPRSTIVDMRR